MVIVYPVTFLKSFVGSNSFLVKGWGFSIYNIILSANRYSFISSFLSWMPFISFSCLIAVVQTFSTMLNRSGEGRHPCLVPDLQGKYVHCWVWCYLWVCHIWLLSCWGTFFCTYYIESFIIQGYWILLNNFSHIHWDDHVIFIVHSVNVLYDIDWLMCVESTLHPRSKFCLITVSNPLNVLLN